MILLKPGRPLKIFIKNNLQFLMLTLLSLAICVYGNDNTQESYRTCILTGREIQEIIPFIAQQRIERYREYPSLYEGSMKDELELLHSYSKMVHSAVAIAYHNNDPIGFVTGVPLVEYDEHFVGSCDLFKKNGKDPTGYYYFVDVIVLPAYQGKGVASRLLEEFECYCRELGFLYTCLVSESNAWQAHKPCNYREPDSLWKRLGYNKANLSIYFTWNTIQPNGVPQYQEHELPYWIKKLR